MWVLTVLYLTNITNQQTFSREHKVTTLGLQQSFGHSDVSQCVLSLFLLNVSTL